MQQRARESGRVLSFDATAQLNEYGYPTYAPTVKDNEGKLRVLAYAVFVAERAEGELWILQSMVEMVPELGISCQAVFTDEAVQEATLRAAFPNLLGAFLCVFHFLNFDMPLNLGRLHGYRFEKEF